jgi:hypothetical protein
MLSHIFSAESEAKQSGPRKKATGARARDAVEDLNGGEPQRLAREGGVGRLSRRRHSCAGSRPWVLKRGSRAEREKWSYTPGDSNLSSRKARGCTPKRSSENGPLTSSSEELGYNSKRSGFRRTLVRPRRMRKERQLAGSTGRKSFLPIDEPQTVETVIHSAKTIIASDLRCVRN